MNISQIDLYLKMHTYGPEQNKKGEIGMLDLAIKVMSDSGLVASPFKLIGHSHSRVGHPLRAKWDEAT